MTADPADSDLKPSPASHEGSLAGDERPATTHEIAERNGSYVVPSPGLPLYEPGHAELTPAEFTSEDVRLMAADLYAPPAPYAVPRRLRRVPNLGNTALFFLLALFLMIVGQGIAMTIAHSLHLFHNASLLTLATDARLSIPSQAVEYTALFALSALLFRLMWARPFLDGVEWNAPAVTPRLRWLVLLGFAVGFGITFGGNYLPMPTNAPIVQDMMNTTAGAWLMFLFSFTGAPLMEELAFRGFLLPSLINAFRWTSDRGWISEGAANWIGIPISVLLTSCCFALMHAPQVSRSWGPVLLIGIVSLVLCIVRLRLKSVLASAVVHAAYNFTLFAGIFISTSAFRHLDKLKG